MKTPSPSAQEASGPDVRLSPLVSRVFGEPRFHADGDVAALAFAKDGTLWSIDEAGALKHWAADGKLLKRSFLSDLETLWCFSPGAKLLASGNDDLVVWDVAEGTVLKRVEQSEWLTALAFSPDGATLVSGHDDGTVRFWDARTQKLVGQIPAHPEPVSAIAYDPSGKFLATAGEDRVVRVWDADSHKKIADLVSHTDRVPALAWSADGSLLVSAGWDTSARVWKPGTPDPLMLLNTHADQVVALAFAPAGQLLATADSDHDIHLWADPVAGGSSRVLRGHTDELRCLTFSPDGKRLASAGLDRVVHVWDVASAKLVAGLNPQGKNDIASFAVGGKVRLASTGGPAFQVWDVDSGTAVTPPGLGVAHSVAASTDGRWLAVGGTDHVTRLVDTADPKAVKWLEATKPPIGAVAFSPGSSTLAHTSPADGLVWIWDPDSPDAKLILIEAADGCTLEALAFHPDGNRVAVGGVDYLSTGERDGAVCVWDLTTKQKSATFDFGVYAVAFDPSGRYLAGAGLSDHVYLWDLSGGELVFELDGHLDKVNAVAFSPDGNYVLSASDDATVRVWDVLSGRIVVTREFDVPVQALAFSPDGRFLFTGNGNTTCYQVEFQRLLDE